jgi:hypothetical protein
MICLVLNTIHIQITKIINMYIVYNVSTDGTQIQHLTVIVQVCLYQHSLFHVVCYKAINHEENWDLSEFQSFVGQFYYGFITNE